jgi:hypothetical protein
VFAPGEVRDGVCDGQVRVRDSFGQAASVTGNTGDERYERPRLWASTPLIFQVVGRALSRTNIRQCPILLVDFRKEFDRGGGFCE